MKTIFRKLLLLIFPFTLSLPLIPLNISSIALGLFCLGAIINEKPSVKRKVKDSFLVLFLLFFLSDTLSNLLRLDFNSHFFREIKLSFLIFPIIFIAYSKTIIENFKPICYSFVFGVLVYVIYSWWFVYDFYYITNRGYRLFSLTDGYIRYMLYNYLPGAIHHTYIGIYIVFSISLILHDIITLKKRIIIKSLLLLILFVSLFFIGSKFSIIMLIFFIFSYLLILKKWIVNFIFIASSLSGLYLIKMWILGVGLNSSFYSRIEYYKCCIIIIKNNFISGVGAGNLSKASSLLCDNDILIPHNIYLRSFAENGILGFLILVAISFYLIKHSLKSKDYLYLNIVLLLILGGLIEDFIFLQRGVLFFMLFLSLFYVKNKYNTLQQI